jgi:hypothetical protein
MAAAKQAFISAAAAITFHPANDKPSTRSAASSQKMMVVSLISSSRLPPDTVGKPPEPQSLGPAQKFHSAPA